MAWLLWRAPAYFRRAELALAYAISTRRVCRVFWCQREPVTGGQLACSGPSAALHALHAARAECMSRWVRQCIGDQSTGKTGLVRTRPVRPGHERTCGQEWTTWCTSFSIVERVHAGRYGGAEMQGDRRIRALGLDDRSPAGAKGVRGFGKIRCRLEYSWAGWTGWIGISGSSP